MPHWVSLCCFAAGGVVWLGLIVATLAQLAAERRCREHLRGLDADRLRLQSPADRVALEQDARALRGDWEVVDRDLQAAMEQAAADLRKVETPDAAKADATAAH